MIKESSVATYNYFDTISHLAWEGHAIKGELILYK